MTFEFVKRTFRVPQNLSDWLNEQADKEQRTVTTVLIRAIANEKKRLEERQ